jgi:hypothetical protein
LRFRQIFKIQIYSIGKKRLLVKVSLSLPFFPTCGTSQSPKRKNVFVIQTTQNIEGAKSTKRKKGSKRDI